MLFFRYYNLDVYHRKAMEKEKKKGLKTSVTERTVFNDEEQRRYVNMVIFYFILFISAIASIFFRKHGTLIISLWAVTFTQTFCMFYERNIMNPLNFNWTCSLLCVE